MWSLFQFVIDEVNLFLGNYVLYTDYSLYCVLSIFFHVFCTRYESRLSQSILDFFQEAQTSRIVKDDLFCTTST